MALEQATRHIEPAVKEVEAATSAESRLAASKKCYRAVWELRGALRDLRERSRAEVDARGRRRTETRSVRSVEGSSGPVASG